MFDFDYFRPVAPICEAERNTDLEYFLEFDFFTTCGSCRQMDELIDTVIEDILIENLVKISHPKRHHERMLRVKTEIRSILWNFYLCAQADYDLYLKLSMRNEAYNADPYRNPFGLSRDIRNVLKLMAEHRWVKIHKGYDRIEGKESKVTRIRQTVKAASYIEKLPNNLESKQSVRQPVILKDRIEKKQIYDPVMMNMDPIRKASDLMERYNEQLPHHEIRISGTNDNYIRYYYKKKPNGRTKGKNAQSDATISSKSDVGSSLVRVDKVQNSAIFYNTEDDALCYGRMHGGFWQSIPSEFRQCLLIDGQRCVELDYSSQILNMVASQHDVQLPDNAYVFEIGMPWLTPIQIKTVVKFAILIGLGSKSKKSAFGGFRQKLKNSSEIEYCDVPQKDSDLERLFDTIIRKYPFLESMMFQDNAIKLFFEDSEVARSIIQVFVDRYKVILAIHDGFVVKAEDEDLLRTAMRQAWEDRFHTQIQIKKEWGGAGFAYPSYYDVTLDRVKTLWPNFVAES
jgi:hypothetical protein